MSQFKTLKKNDPLFKSYLWGQFSDHLIARPINNLNVGSEQETVTFELVERHKINKPSMIELFFKLIKIRNYVLIFIPLLYIASKNYVDDRFFDPSSFALAIIGSLFLFAAFNIRNDIHDHLSGYDRVNIDHREKPIVKGWVTANEASMVSWILIVIAAVCSVPVMLAQHESARVVAVILILTFLGKLLSKNSYKNQRWGEIIFFLLIGPTLVAGYQTSLGSGVDTECLVFGIMWAWAIQFLVHLNNFSHIMTSSQAGIKNTITNAGFDKAKKILVLWWLLFLGLWTAFHYFYASIFWSWLATLILVFWSIPTLIKIAETQSPVGSDLLSLRKVGYRNFLLMAGLIVLEFLWYCLVDSGRAVF